ncbi:MAG: hypothetical protein HY392_03725 [Candidatus Diapherotrites archaeon]|nr:hypothetical protein [Candidatus Diapherotrites archaeon]
MSKAKIVLFLGFLAVLIGILVVYTQPKTPESLEYVKDPETGEEYLAFEFATEEEINPFVDPDEQGFEKATSAQECDKKSGYMKDECYRNLSLIKKDASYCMTISEPGHRDNCIYDLAVETGNADLCGEMDFDIPDCLREVAVKTQNPAYCEAAGFERETCIEAAKQRDFDLCKKLGLNRRHCNYAADTGDTTYCNNIIDAGKNCFYELALATLKADYCEKTIELKNACVFRVAIDSENPNACNLLAEGRDNCVATIALNTNNPALCDQAGFERESCLEDIQAGQFGG